MRNVNDASGDDAAVNLDREELYDAEGRHITTDYIADAVAELEEDTVPVDESRVHYPRRGRPSLSGASSRSPRLDARVPASVKHRVADLAHRQHRNESDIVRAALEEYLARH